MGTSWFRLRQCLILSLSIFVFFVLLRSYQATLSQPIVVAQPYPPQSLIQLKEEFGLDVIVLGSDDGSKRKNKMQNGTGSDVCNIPKLNINETEVIGFFEETKPLVCGNGKQKNWVFINDKAKIEFIDERKGASCTATPFSRVNDNELLKGPAVAVKEGQKQPADYVIFKCTLGSESWTGLSMSVIPDTRRIEELKKVSPPADWSGLDIVFLGLDSLSQMTFRRKLPKTVKFLEEELGSVVLNGYNIVGDGTPQAFIPILTGGTEEELPLTRKRFKNANYVDDVYPFVWRNFSSAGYSTLYGEDAAAIGTFTYRLKGFHHQPTDHYTRTYFQEAESFESDAKCSGTEPLYKSWFRYAREFMAEYTIPRFLLMHLSMYSHDDINLVGVLDDEFSSTLRSLLQSGSLDNSLVIVMADHGHRFASLRATHQGQLEERLPFFSLALPKKFRDSEKGRKAWENLQKNKDRLTSPFDIHQTLLDILHWPTDLDRPHDVSEGRSLSLWREIPETRTCSQAGIEAHWCTCLDWKDAMVTDEDRKLSFKLAKAIVEVMNAQTSKERSICAPLKLKQLHYSKKLVPNDGVMKYKNVKDADGFVPDLSGTTKTSFAHYQLKVSTSPGRAVYEVTLMYHEATKKVEIDLSAISHISKYGDDPHCIIDRNYFLATYCVCYDKIERDS